MREMRLKKREITDQRLLLEILEECSVVRIGARDQDGMFIVPMNFGYEWKEGELPRLYLHCAREGRKAQAFQAEPKVAFEMDCGHGLIRGDYTCGYSYSYRSLMGVGELVLATEKEEKRKGLELLVRHMAPDAELRFSPAMLEAADVYCLQILELSGKERKAKKKEQEGSDHDLP